MPNQYLRVIAVLLGLVVMQAPTARAQVSYGVNNPRLLTSPEAVWKASLDTMSANGVHLVRTAIGKTTTPETLLGFLCYAERLLIKVILVFSEGHESYFPPEAPVHEYSGGFPAGRGLAAIDISRFETYWRTHRAAVRQAGVHVYAYELGNEVNGASFNRDYPIGADARLLDLQACDRQPGCTTVRAGWDKYIAMLQVMRSSNLLDGALLIGGSFVRVGEGYVQSIHGSFSTVSSTRAYLAAHDADRLVDAYSFHVYPVVPPTADLVTAEHEISRQIGAVYTECRSSGSKPCWITEWGFPDAGTKCQDSPRQDAFIRYAADVFRMEASQQGGMTTAYYAWDTGDKFAIFGCGHIASPVMADLLRSH